MIERRFSYRARTASGRPITGVTRAATRAEALRHLNAQALAPTDLRETAEPGLRAGSGGNARADAAIVLQQLAALIGAGVELLEALETIAQSLDARPIAAPLRAIAGALRAGDDFSNALATYAPFYPGYVHALVRAAERSGALAQTLRECADQITTDDAIRRDIRNALIYPLFLLASGGAAVLFLLTAIVPRFADMLTAMRATATGLGAVVLGASASINDHPLLAFGGLAGLIAGATLLLQSRQVQDALRDSFATTPGVRTLYLSRVRHAWARIMALSLSAGVGILEANDIASGAISSPALRAKVRGANASLRAGGMIDESFAHASAVSVVDASLLRAGQRSGALAHMFAIVSQRNGDVFRTALKRFTAIIEPVATAMVAAGIGVIVLGLVSALVSVYEGVGQP
ncbi:MAG: hypothetical protein GC189_02400 [Alphaproteobacteria bacterium]|nr:hypothetical protein [Alphaproteobacteria bacterium]